ERPQAWSPQGNHAHDHDPAAGGSVVEAGTREQGMREQVRAGNKRTRYEPHQPCSTSQRIQPAWPLPVWSGSITIPFFIGSFISSSSPCSLFPCSLLPRSLPLCFSHLTISGKRGHTPELCHGGAVSLDAHGTGFLWISFLSGYFLLPY